MDTKEVKELLLLKTSTHDEYITLMIPLLTDFVKAHCKNSFELQKVDGTTITEYTGGVKIFIAKAIQYYMNKSGISSTTISRVTISFAQELPKSILDLLEPYKQNVVEFF